MIGGLLIDLLLVAAVAAFAWAGLQLGALASLGRVVASALGFSVAVLLRDPAGDIVGGIIGGSVDFNNLVGMLAIGIGCYLAVTRVFFWWLGRRSERRAAAAAEGEFEPDLDPLDSDAVAMSSGGVLGLAWVLLFVALLVLLPADNLISRSAVRSVTGGVLIRQQHALEWLRTGFPHYTQTLPKGEEGVVVGEQENLPMWGDEPATARSRDADVMLRVINRARRARSVQTLAFNPDIAEVARRHAETLAAERTLSRTSTTGASLDGRVRAALGASSDDFSEEIGVEVAWAHGPANAAVGMLDDTRAGALLRDGAWTEVGIGVVDAGWFNGRIYVVLLVGPADEDDASAAAEPAIADADDLTVQPDDATGADATDDTTGSDVPTTSGECEPFDLDGDGVADAESVDPSCAEAATG